MNQGLKVAVEGEEIVIRLPFDCLVTAAENDEELERWSDSKGNFRKVRVLNRTVFAAEVVRELEREEEDGTTPVHTLFDRAFENAVEQGAEGIWIEGIDE